jgi:agmatine deiminase
LAVLLAHWLRLCSNCLVLISSGRPLRVHKLPQPGPLYLSEAEAAGIKTAKGTQPRRAGDRLAASYVNFYLPNRRVIMPLLDPGRDDQARRILKRIFPDREVVGVEAREILLGGGNIHCITQQVPAVTRVKAAPRRPPPARRRRA